MQENIQLSSDDLWFGLDALSDDSFLRTGRIPPALSVIVSPSQTTSSSISTQTPTPAPTLIATLSKENNSFTKGRSCSLANLPVATGMQSGTVSSCLPKLPTFDVTLLQSHDNGGFKNDIIPISQETLMDSKADGVTLNPLKPLQVLVRGTEKKAPLLDRTLLTEIKPWTGSSQSQVRSSLAVPPISKTQKIAYDRRDDANLKRYFEDSPPVKTTKQQSKIVQTPAVCVSGNDEQKAYSAEKVHFTKVKTELREQYLKSESEISNTNGKQAELSPPNLDRKLGLEEKLQYNTDLAMTRSNKPSPQQAARMATLDKSAESIFQMISTSAYDIVPNKGTLSAQASNSGSQVPEYSERNETIEQIAEALEARVLIFEQDLKTCRKVADDSKRVAEAELFSVDQNCAEKVRISSHALKEAQAMILKLMNECEELRVAVNEPLEKAKKRNAELEEQLGNMRYTTEESERKAKVKMQKLEEHISKRKQQHGELQSQFSKWRTNPAEIKAQMEENKQIIAQQESTITDLKKKLEDSDAKVAKLTDKLITHVREIKCITEPEVQTLKRQLEQAVKREKEVDQKLKAAEARNKKSEQLLVDSVTTQAKDHTEATCWASAQQTQDFSNNLGAQLEDREAKIEQFLKKLHESNESIVRLSNQLSELRDSCERPALLKYTKDDTQGQPQVHDSGKKVILSQDFQLLRKELATSDEKVAQLTQELETHLGNHKDYRIPVDVREWSDRKESTALQIRDLETNCPLSASCSPQLAKQYPGQDKDLIQSIAQKERRIQHLENKLTECVNKNTFLSEQLRQLSLAGSTQQQLTDLRKRIQEFEAKNNRLTQELSETQKRHRALEGVEEKLLASANKFRGGAHLVTPPGTAKLPETVFTCIECYVKGLLCDNCSRCENCNTGGHACLRWKCSVHKHLGYCPDMPCALVHDEDGWLITKNAIPQW